MKALRPRPYDDSRPVASAGGFGPASRQRPRDMRVVVAGRSRSTGRTVRRGADGCGGRNGESRVHDQTLRESPAGARAARATLRRGEGCGHGPTGCREPLPHLRPPQRRRCSPVCIPSPLARIFYGRRPGSMSRPARDDRGEVRHFRVKPPSAGSVRTPRPRHPLSHRSGMDVSRSRSIGERNGEGA